MMEEEEETKRTAHSVEETITLPAVNVAQVFGHYKVCITNTNT